MLIFARPLTAQPLASSSGPTLRCRNFSQAITIERSEITRLIPPIPRRTFHQARSTNFAKTVARNVPIDPSATLSPMIEERSSFLGGAPGIAGGGAPGAAAGGGGG